MLENCLRYTGMGLRLPKFVHLFNVEFMENRKKQYILTVYPYEDKLN